MLCEFRTSLVGVSYFPTAGLCGLYNGRMDLLITRPVLGINDVVSGKVSRIPCHSEADSFLVVSLIVDN